MRVSAVRMHDQKGDIVRETLEKEYSGLKYLIDDVGATCRADIELACIAVAETIINNGKIFLAGNGGSATQAEHIAAEFVGRFRKERQPYFAQSLGSNFAAITAIANDYGYEQVFSRELRAMANSKDLLIVLTTSGKSKNIIHLLETAQELGVRAIGLTGSSGQSLRKLCSVTVAVPSIDTARVQEIHLFIGHVLANLGEIVLVGAI